jgi:SAM-dependent methyltransferase
VTYENVLEDLRLAYDRAADERDAKADDLWKQEERRQFLTLLQADGAKSLIEIGAGHGVSGLFFQQQGLDVTCTDLSAELVARCRSKGLKAFQMDFLGLEFPPKSFDAMFAMNCLLHVPRAELVRVLLTLREVIRPGGLFYLGQYGGVEREGPNAGDHYEPKRFFSFLSESSFKNAAAQVFDVFDYKRIEMENWESFYQALILRRKGSIS